jgi:hypothetical protein
MPSFLDTFVDTFVREALEEALLQLPHINIGTIFVYEGGCCGGCGQGFNFLFPDGEYHEDSAVVYEGQQLQLVTRSDFSSCCSGRTQYEFIVLGSDDDPVVPYDDGECCESEIIPFDDIGYLDLYAMEDIPMSV